jgi:hypothetical protein
VAPRCRPALGKLIRVGENFLFPAGWRSLGGRTEAGPRCIHSRPHLFKTRPRGVTRPLSARPGKTRPRRRRTRPPSLRIRPRRNRPAQHSVRTRPPTTESRPSTKSRVSAGSRVSAVRCRTRSARPRPVRSAHGPLLSAGPRRDRRWPFSPRLLTTSPGTLTTGSSPRPPTPAASTTGRLGHSSHLRTRQAAGLGGALLSAGTAEEGGAEDDERGDATDDQRHADGGHPCRHGGCNEWGIACETSYLRSPAYGQGELGAGPSIRSLRRECRLAGGHAGEQRDGARDGAAG